MKREKGKIGGNARWQKKTGNTRKESNKRKMRKSIIGKKRTTKRGK